MPLFTDGSISTIEDLRAYDAAIFDLASAEGVDLQAKLLVAKEEIGTELEEILQKRGGLSNAAGLSHVVVTPALKQWHTLYTLTLLYGDIHSSHVNRRFEKKWKDYRIRARRAAETLSRIGIGVVARPIAKAMPPVVRTIPGTLETGEYCIQVSWTGGAGEEGCASEALTWTLTEPGLIAVRAVEPPVGVAGYHVYVGELDSTTGRQSTTPMGVGGEWTMPPTGLVNGVRPKDGQEPERYIRNDRILQRG
jgi:hypothetical protein